MAASVLHLSPALTRSGPETVRGMEVAARTCLCYCMHMALDRRVQILLDDRRYAVLEREAVRRGTSVAALIRAAIDRTYAGSDANRRAAGEALLAADPMPVEDWEDMKAGMLDEMAGG